MLGDDLCPRVTLWFVYFTFRFQWELFAFSIETTFSIYYIRARSTLGRSAKDTKLSTCCAFRKRNISEKCACYEMSFAKTGSRYFSFKTISPNTFMKESINPDNYLQEFSGRATDRAVLKNSFGIEGLNILNLRLNI